MTNRGKRGVGRELKRGRVQGVNKKKRERIIEGEGDDRGRDRELVGVGKKGVS